MLGRLLVATLNYTLGLTTIIVILSATFMVGDWLARANAGFLGYGDRFCGRPGYQQHSIWYDQHPSHDRTEYTPDLPKHATDR